MKSSVLKACRAAVVIVAHALIASVLVICASAVDHLTRALNGEQDMVI